MAWNWSHTTEAYENARGNVLDIARDDPMQTLVILAEWEATAIGDDSFDFPEFSEKEYRKSFKRNGKRYYRARETGMDLHFLEGIAETIWDKASEFQTCDNGGYNAWICPYGCHSVPFDREED